MKKQQDVFASATQDQPAFDMAACPGQLWQALQSSSTLSQGTVTARVKGGFLVDIGLKADAFVATKECRRNPPTKL